MNYNFTVQVYTTQINGIISLLNYIYDNGSIPYNNLYESFVGRVLWTEHLIQIQKYTTIVIVSLCWTIIVWEVMTIQ